MSSNDIINSAVSLVRSIKLEKSFHEIIEPIFGSFMEKRNGALWGSAAGKSHIADKLIRLFPSSSIYVEPFAGGAGVFWAKEKQGTEVLNDIDVLVSGAFKFLRDLTDSDISDLKKLDWTVSKELYDRLKRSNPSSLLEAFHKTVMIRYASFRIQCGSIDRSVIGNTILDRVLKSLDNAKERLRGVKIYGEDYRKTVSRYDSKDTLLFLDPPYVETNVRVGEKDFDHKAFFDFLGQVKSKFLITYDKPDPTGKFKTNKLNHSAWRGTNVGTTSHTTYIITNYEIQKKSVSWKGII